MIRLLALCAACTLDAATLTPETIRAFERYIALTEAQMNANLTADRFLHVSGKPDLKARLRNGEILTEQGETRDNGKKVDIPKGLIQDWVGTLWIPGATVANVRAVLQDYAHYKDFYKPEVTESRVISHHDDDYEVFLRLYKKHLLTVVLNSTYHVHYAMLDPQRLYVTSHATRIAEVKDSKHPDAGEHPVGNDSGFLWRLNSYWRFEQADGGVYAQCEAISLSRDVPGFLAWMIRGFLEKVPKESMQNTLRDTKAAVLASKKR